MTRHSLIFDGINSADYGVWISGDNVFASPSRDVEYVSVPGRNGDLIIDNGKWNNIRLTYPAFIPRGYDSQIDEFRRVISKKKGYRKLEDDYHPEEYRLASFSAGISPNNQSAFYRSGRFDLTFNCKPQRFLVAGEETRTFRTAGTLNNPSQETALPLIRVYGFGTLTVGDTVVTITQHGQQYMDIDCELGDAYCGSINLNAYVTKSFPTLGAGETGLAFSGNITRVDITPHWWRV